MEKVGNLSLVNFSFMLGNHSVGDLLFIPKTPNDDEYYYEDFDFKAQPLTDNTSERVDVEILDSRQISQVEDENYDGEKTIYLLAITDEDENGNPVTKDFILDDGSSSWGDCNPTIEEVKPVQKFVYISADGEHIFTA